MDKDQKISCLCNTAFKYEILKIIQEINQPLNLKDIIIITTYLIVSHEGSFDYQPDYVYLRIIVKNFIDELVKLNLL